ncbi:hypothetical protein HDU76_001340 [Blyttiomyces sp. JEL0837]|nr:hypothetical protein HDU76_001340 [Blyttiomyces sp. JEL0837]
MARSIKASELVDIVLAAGEATEKLNKTVTPMVKQFLQGHLSIHINEPDITARLDPSVHTLGYLFCIVVRMRMDKSYDLQFVQNANFLATKANPVQLWICPDLVIAFAQTLSHIAERTCNYAVPIQPLLKIILSSAFSSDSAVHNLTPLHPILLKYCLLAKMYRQALPIVETDITSVDKATFELRVQDYLLYHYYGGMICIGMKKYAKALELLLICVSTPSVGNAVSAIQIESYRKALLISLLLKGTEPTLPKYTTRVVAQACKAQSPAYVDFAKAFESGNQAKVETEFVKHMDSFAKSRNLGLVRQCLAALPRRKISNLTQTYLTLSLPDIAKAVGIDQADASAIVESEVLHLIEDREVLATLSYKFNGVVSFHDSQDRFDTVSETTRLSEEVRLALEATKRINKFDKSIALSRDYLAKVLSQEGRITDRSSGGGQDRFISGSYDDEAMMDDWK